MLSTPFPPLPLEHNAKEIVSDPSTFSTVEEQMDELEVYILEPRPTFQTEAIPSEVWAEILFCASSGEIRFGDPFDTTRNVALVSKHLSYVASGTPKLWATVVATRRDIISLSSRNSKAFLVQAFIRLLDLAVQRSKACPFRLLVAPAFPSRSVSEFSRNFFPVFERLTEANVCESWLAHGPRNGTVSLPMLHSLEISQHPGKLNIMQGRKIDAPNLQTLSFTGIRATFNISAPNLTCLSLHTCALIYDELIRLLSATESLSFLTLDRIQLRGSVLSLGKVSLSRLRSVVIIDEGPFPNDYLASLVAPGLTQFSLWQYQQHLGVDVVDFIERSKCKLKQVRLSGKFSRYDITTILNATPELESLQLLRLCRPQEILEQLADTRDSSMLVPKLRKFTFTDVLCLSAPPGLATFLTQRSSQLSQVHIRMWKWVDSHIEDFSHLRTISKKYGFELVLEGLEQAVEFEPSWFLLRY